MYNGTLVFLSAVAFAVFVLMIGVTVPVFGERKKVQKRLKKRLESITANPDYQPAQSIIRQKYLKQLSPIEKQLESLPLLERLARLIEQAGHQQLAYRFVLRSFLFAAAAASIIWMLTNLIWAAVTAGLLLLVVPFVKLLHDCRKRIEKFEEQFPEALDLMTRSLQAGHPFNKCIQIVAQEFPDPIAKEFSLTYADLNYGNDINWALAGLLERVPSVTLIAFVSSILIHKDSGGNLAEVLMKISTVIRGRFKFHRKVKTLTAEGRVSAMVLTLVPFALFGMIWLTTPDYLTILTQSADGRNLIMYGMIAMVVGVYWMRKLLRIEV
ncbi:type II secretion system F family protein [Motiliproteus sp. SC1-56]|uniref:type II secretion system F family protein n=1 Tax=Motiliproteus sp. SC1-56 TaxID=2799565 RepID=UPI001A8DCD1C|nr:type II secretion system F family protein [Motiliproteus sp. SC1-56]